MAAINFTLKIPATSANLGPGFDTLGVALGLFLTVTGSYASSGEDEKGSVDFEFQGDGQDEMSTDPEINLLTRTSLYVLRSMGRQGFGGKLVLKVDNRIPLGRGLGSSGAAVVAGVLLGDLIGGFKMDQGRLLDFILAIERHPDNVVPCLIGGLVVAYIRNTSLDISIQSSQILNQQDEARRHVADVPLSEEVPNDHLAKFPPLPPRDAVRFAKLQVHPSIRAIAVIPAYPLATSKARGVLPPVYEKSDVIFNLQRLAVLTQSLGQDPPIANTIFGAMTDKLHQPYRKHLIPGLNHALESLTPESHPGLLGLCLSGAGPTVLALATSNFMAIGQSIKSLLDLHGNTDCQVLTLDLLTEGSQVIINENGTI